MLRPRLFFSEIKSLIDEFEMARSKVERDKKYFEYRLERLEGRLQQQADGLCGLEYELKCSQERANNAHLYLTKSTKILESARNKLVQLGIKFE